MPGNHVAYGRRSAWGPWAGVRPCGPVPCPRRRAIVQRVQRQPRPILGASESHPGTAGWHSLEKKGMTWQEVASILEKAEMEMKNGNGKPRRTRSNLVPLTPAPQQAGGCCGRIERALPKGHAEPVGVWRQVVCNKKFVGA